MALTEQFYKDVRNGNVRGVRIMMKDSLLIDSSFAEFREMEKETQSLNGLYDEHDGRELKSDKAEWNDGYMNRLMVQVVGNFSHERVEHLKKVVQYLRPPDVFGSKQKIPDEMRPEYVHEKETVVAEDSQEQTCLANSREARIVEETVDVNPPAYVPPRKISYEEQKRRDCKNGSVIYNENRIGEYSVSETRISKEQTDETEKELLEHILREIGKVQSELSEIKVRIESILKI